MSAQKKWVFQYRKNCIGCGNCVTVCPEYWRMNDADGKAELIDGVVEKGELHRTKLDPVFAEENQQAAELCPVGIIKVR